MLTRSKTRALAAESAEGQKGHEGSSLVMKLPADWSELSVELLMMIFENLTIESDSSNEQRTPLLNCRLVNHQWKSVMDDLLEKRSLSFWKAWKQPRYNLYKFPVVQYYWNGKNIVENVTFPSFLQGNVESCPFPTKSVWLTSAQTCKNNWNISLTGNAYFFTKYGHHLTSLTIEDVSNRNYFTAQTFRDLLFKTPHLKAMALQGVKIKLLETDVGRISLPPLPHLCYMRLEDIHCSQVFEFDAQSWILEFYKEQLISVECNKELGYENSQATFPLLKQLEIWYCTPGQFLAPVGLPSLTCLDLMIIRHDVLEWGEILELLFKFLSGMASTLVELQLDIVENERKKTNPINYEKDQSALRKIQQSRFPALKKLTITYPKYEEEVKVLKDFLKMLPNLEILNFTRFEVHSSEQDPEPTELQMKTVKEHVNMGKYQGVCPKLRIINVYMYYENGGRRPFFTSRFPFSA